MEVAHHFYKCILSLNLKALIVIEKIQYKIYDNSLNV